MIEQSFAETFAAEWIAAWNSHDLESILSHYVEDFEFGANGKIIRSFAHLGG